MRPIFPRAKGSPSKSPPRTPLRWPPPSSPSLTMPDLPLSVLPVATNPLDSLLFGRPQGSGGWQPDASALWTLPSTGGNFNLRARL